MLKQRHFIDIHKGITPLFIIGLISHFNQWDNQIALLYLSLHGTYGLLWITKSYVFPDKQWERRTSIFYGLLIWISLSLYWVAPYLIVTNTNALPIFSDPPFIYFSICVAWLFIIHVGTLIFFSIRPRNCSISKFLLISIFILWCIYFISPKYWYFYF